MSVVVAMAVDCVIAEVATDVIAVAVGTDVDMTDFVTDCTGSVAVACMLALAILVFSGRFQS